MARDFDRYFKMMHSRNGMTSEEGFDGLRRIATEHVDELMAAYAQEREMHGWLLEFIGEARSPKAFDLFVGELDGSQANWARRGLEKLDTKEARRALRQHDQNTRGFSRPGAAG